MSDSTHDALGARMKQQYEWRSCVMLPRRTYTIVRLDGRHFHSFTRQMERPYDERLIDALVGVAKRLCADAQGAAFAYHQSDEVSLLLTDFQAPKTEAWFDGNLQKICSISASVLTAWFNIVAREAGWGLAFFDARAFTISDPVEVENYFIWRQQNATRNAIQMAAQNCYSDKELFGKNVNEQQEMLFSKGINFNDYPVRFKRGSVVRRVPVQKDVVWTHKKTGVETTTTVEASEWTLVDPPIFTKDRSWLSAMIPRLDSIYGKFDGPSESPVGGFDDQRTK